MSLYSFYWDSLYVNIVETSNVLKFILFADDTAIVYSHTDIRNQIPKINKELLEVSNWFMLTNYQ